MSPLIEMNEMHDDAWMIREINSFEMIDANGMQHDDNNRFTET